MLEDFDVECSVIDMLPLSVFVIVGNSWHLYFHVIIPLVLT